jgi:hypothetical protein
LLTDADSYWGNATSSTGGGCCLAADQFNRRLEKSIGQFDVTHNFKIGFVYDLPFGKGRQYLTHGFASWVLGNWGVNGVLTYSSGTPVGITSSYLLPIYGATRGRSTPYITSYNNWRQFPNLNENMSLTRSFPIKEQFRIEFRAEAFNLFNRVRFGTGDVNLQDQNFGRLTSSSDLLNTPRQLQLALKVYF